MHIRYFKYLRCFRRPPSPIYSSPAELQAFSVTSPHDIVSLSGLRRLSDRSESCYCERANVAPHPPQRRMRTESEGGMSQCSKVRYTQPLYVTYDRRHRRVLSTCLDTSRMRNVLKINPIPIRQSLVDMTHRLIEMGQLPRTDKYRGCKKN